MSSPPGVPARPALTELHIADPPGRWRALGFTVDDQRRLNLGGITIHLGAQGSGITAWTISGIDPAIADLDGLPTHGTPTLPKPSVPNPPNPNTHPNTHANAATGLDRAHPTPPPDSITSSSPPPTSTGRPRRSPRRNCPSGASATPAPSVRAFAASDRRSSSSSRPPDPRRTPRTGPLLGTDGDRR